MPVISHLVRPEIAQLEAYTPIVPPDVLAERLGLPIEQFVKLDANENPYGPAPRVRDLLGGVGKPPDYHIYPDPDQTYLRQALARYTGQPVERIICGAGADEMIDLLMRLLLAPGDAIIDCPPTFGMYSFDAGVCGGRAIQVPRNADFSLNLPAIEATAHTTGAKILFITSPNNPTGTPTTPAEIARLLALPLLVIVDEAYIEFSDLDPRYANHSLSVSSWVGRYENLAVLRTFSKWAGLAGLRVGYGLLPEWLATHVWKIKQPYNISVAGQLAAIASIEDAEYLRANVRKIIAERERLFAALTELPFLAPVPSITNFILCRVTQGSAATIKQALAKRGILIRYYNNALLRDYIRISVGTPAQSERLLAALQALNG